MSLSSIPSSIPISGLVSGSLKAATVPKEDSGFAALLNSAVSAVEGAHGTAVKATEDLLTRGQGDIHEVALLSQRAELSLELFQQVRNKLVQAYQEVMRMPM